MLQPDDDKAGQVILESENHTGMLDDLDFIPPEYQATMKPLLYPIEDYVGDLLLRPQYQIKPDSLDTYRKDGVTHIALLSLAYDGKKARFGAGEFSLAFVIYYCAAHNKYRLLHCTSCATCVSAWIVDMQPEWNLYESRGLQKARPSYH